MDKSLNDNGAVVGSPTSMICKAMVKTADGATWF